MWLVGAGKSPRSLVRLFCVPHAGAGISAYSGWANELTPEVELVTVQLPGRESRFHEPACCDFTQLVQDVSDSLSAHLDKSFALFGNSFGALVAYEVVHELRRRFGAAPVHLFVSACGAPQLAPFHTPIADIPDAELIAELDHRYSGIPEAIRQDPEFLQAILPAVRADLKMLESYSYQRREPLSCPIAVFGGDRDPTLSPGQLDAWREQTTGPFRLEIVHGGHLYLRSARHRLIEAIRKAVC